ncbi:hypothetical protein CYLTODRAFT_489277 [Cylindrobasidium torrendii FP15055 ss-10]|uniref:DUF6534 domain-containing protein n=1 Tax=Cylindrobasidium torrendii FP15055 ss-10 TaxID=1314674 RepID=A0A0D7BFQ9_9AGAR|nr:hypothetical protein CYLTODRAFT_489277 [Cylindrobasidium torrendii FP15055 ss-10]
MPPLSLADPTIDNTVGAVFLGILGACILFGITTLQAYIYFQRYPEDGRLNKLAVSVLWLLDTFHLVLLIQAMYTCIVTHFGDRSKFLYVSWAMKLQVAVVVVIILLVQCMYTVRIWILGGYHHSNVLRALVVFAITGGFGIGTVFAYEMYQQTTFEGLSSISWALDASLAYSTFIDFVLSFSMCYYLRKSKTCHTNLNSRIWTVMQHSLSSGLITSTCSLSALFTYVLLPNTLVFVAIEFLLTRLYVGSFLALLNAREPRKIEGAASVLEATVRVDSVVFRPMASDASVNTARPRPDSDVTIRAKEEKFTPIPVRNTRGRSFR